jgi:hypothetical protein
MNIFLMFLNYFDVFLKNKKYIFLIYFRIKNILKNNRYHIPKYHFKILFHNVARGALTRYL